MPSNMGHNNLTSGLSTAKQNMRSLECIQPIEQSGKSQIVGLGLCVDCGGGGGLQDLHLHWYGMELWLNP